MATSWCREGGPKPGAQIAALPHPAKAIEYTPDQLAQHLAIAIELARQRERDPDDMRTDDGG
jgi:hypothetical protein